MKGMKHNVSTHYILVCNYDEDLLLAALTDEDADRVVELLDNGKRINIDTPDHDIHYDKPKEFTDILLNF